MLKIRIKQALDEKEGATQADLARACNVKTPSVADWFSGETKSLKAATAIRAADFLGVNQLWLTEGKGPMRPHVAGDSHTRDSQGNVSCAPSLRGSVPVISFVQAGGYTEAIDTLPPGEGERIDVSVPVNRHTFALRVQGDSMEPDFPAGFIIVVEPELDPMPGDYVIAKNGDDATFKQLIKDGADWYLKPMNPRYPIKPLGEARIIGVVREAIRKLR